ncbi:Acyl-CoA reductase (LuxC) superfamily protein [Pseudovibrio sp. JE062]|nr:Acyl-CoA reductase (LuxC) superfamily protein [Pseudovibrio sp. JE062]
MLGSSAALPFSEDAIRFVQGFSKEIFANRNLKQFPEIIALAHWMRKANILTLKQKFESETTERFFLGRGVALHIAPANVDTIFLYSVLLSLLAGNANIVRISTRKSPALDALVTVLQDLLSQDEFSKIAARLLIVRYERDDHINADLCSQVDLRVLWGGDQTVKSIREIPTRPATRDVCFPDRWSLAVINANSITSEADVVKLVKQFANDVYWFGQNACSSPRAVAWLGDVEKVRSISSLFWSALTQEAIRFQDEFGAVDYVNKLISQSHVVLDGYDASMLTTGNNLVSVVRFSKSVSLPMDQHNGCGLFYEVCLEDLSDLRNVLDKKSQTVCSYGVSKQDWLAFLQEKQIAGIDRVVPFGEALTFNSVWDGMDLMREFTREIAISI